VSDNPLWSGWPANTLSSGVRRDPQAPVNTLASLSAPNGVGPADAYAFNAQAAQDWLDQQRAISAQQGLWNDQTGLPTGAGVVDAARQYAGGLLMGSTAPGMKGIRLAKTEVVPGETELGQQYDVHVNPGAGRLKQLLNQSDGSVRVSPGGHDVAVADASKATHSDIEMALMDSDHPMLGQMDPEGVEQLGLILRGTKGDPQPGAGRVGDWNVALHSANNGPTIPPAEWPEGLRRAVGWQQAQAVPQQTPGFIAYHGSPRKYAVPLSMLSGVGHGIVTSSDAEE
jgi:hypothetical protein